MRSSARVDVSVANSSVATAEYKEKRYRLRILCPGCFPLLQREQLGALLLTTLGSILDTTLNA